VTYRLSVHTTADDPTKYRSDDEVKLWEKRDPLIRFKKYLCDRGVLDDASIAGIEEDIRSEIKAAVDYYEAYDGLDPLDAFRFCFANVPAELAAQRDELSEALKNEGYTGAKAH
jgi:TPP-dependent pyruvate/acetoin dehydrogenase alpha subunit